MNSQCDCHARILFNDSFLGFLVKGYHRTEGIGARLWVTLSGHRWPNTVKLRSLIFDNGTLFWEQHA